MLKCKDVSRIIACDELSDATRSRRLAVRIHLLMCRHCRAYASQLRTLAAASRKLARGLVPDVKHLADLERSISRRAFRNDGGDSGQDSAE